MSTVLHLALQRVRLGLRVSELSPATIDGRSLDPMRVLDQLPTDGTPVDVLLLPEESRDGRWLGRVCDFLDRLSRRDVNIRVRVTPNGDYTTSWKYCGNLWRLNSEVAICKSPHGIFERATGNLYRQRDFHEVQFAGRKVRMERTNAKGETTFKWVNAATEWLQWPYHFIVPGVTYAPGEDEITKSGHLNLWRGLGVQPREGDVSPWHHLMEFMFAGDPEARKWFEQWLAYPLQHLGAKLYTAVTLWSPTEGTGKSLIGETMCRIYGANGITVKGGDLFHGFNSWAAQRQFVLADEVIVDSTSRRESTLLQNFITQESIEINEKFVPKYRLRNCFQMLITSNSPKAQRMNTTDRRNFVWETPRRPLTPSFYSNVYDPWLKGDGPAALLAYLLKVDLTGFHPKQSAPMTQAKAAMITAAKSEVGQWVEVLKADPAAALANLGEQAASGLCVATNAILLRAFDPHRETRTTPGALGTELSTEGFAYANAGKVVRLSGGPTRLWVLRDVEKWERADAVAVREHLAQFGWA